MICRSYVFIREYIQHYFPFFNGKLFFYDFCNSRIHNLVFIRILFRFTKQVLYNRIGTS